MLEAEEIREQLVGFRDDFQKLRTEVGRVIVGQREIVDGTLAALIAGGHVLLEGVPGLGKTMLVRTLAEALHLEFSRVQFTPDLMPADLVGTNVVVETPDSGRRFEFQKGPLFANIVLTDEINRATPKTQSALLEAMAEQSVTVAGQTYALPKPFLVLATQNPLEMEGTYPLPEAQLDRFFMKLLVQYPTADDLSTILNRTTGSQTPKAEAVISGERILELRELARQIPVGEDVQRYAINMVLATHPDQSVATDMVKQYVRFGASPRGAQALILYAKILAILDSRFHIAKDDVNVAAPAVLRHRMILNFEGQAENVSPDDVVADLIRHADGSSVAA
ncbi:MAG: MoxR family ATPase [Fuerstiella sp.]|nr:MoxR family ATPase [Fuerstiella sp.]MCP4510517.1 MoxR family ATPase [Fuerstiella sp.]